ncbi:MAG: tetratricopeptide repeat protein [Bacteroidetes bacterium]|nr:tetratricopeptide repeat protein [Bacteroidota bacterium]
MKYRKMGKFKQYLFLVILIISLSDLSFGYKTTLQPTSSIGIKPVPASKDFKSDFDLAREYINNGQYTEATTILLRLIKDDPDNCNLNFLLGYCYYNIEAERNKALPYLQKAILNTRPDYNDNSSKERSAPVYAYYYLGLSYHWAGKLDEAMTHYEKFKEFLINKNGKLINQKNYEVYQELNLKMEQVKIARNLMANPLKIEFVKIPFVNSGAYSSYGAQLTNDENFMYYTRERIGEKVRGRSDMYILKRSGQNWVKNDQVGSNLNGPYNDIFDFISSEGKFLLFSSDRKGVFNIFYSMQDQNKWTEPYDNLSINSNYNETYAILSADGTKMLFVSDRPGGFGGKDIYKIEKKADGSWSQPENLGFTINTPLDEDTPWLSDDGTTLYFSSQGHSSMGGFDIFMSKFRNNMWLEPVNIGYPFNSVADDLYFKWVPKNNLALLTTNRKTGGNNYEIMAARYLDSTRVNEVFRSAKEPPPEDTTAAQQQTVTPEQRKVTADTTRQPVEIEVQKPDVGKDSIRKKEQAERELKEETDRRMKEQAEKVLKEETERRIKEQAERDKLARQDSVARVRQKRVSDSLAAARTAQLKNEVQKKNMAEQVKAKKKQDSIAAVREKERQLAIRKAIEEKKKQDQLQKEKLRNDSIELANKIAEEKANRLKAQKEKEDQWRQQQLDKEKARTDSLAQANQSAEEFANRQKEQKEKDEKLRQQQLEKEKSHTDSLAMADRIEEEKIKRQAEEKQKEEIARQQTVTEKTRQDSLERLTIRLEEETRKTQQAVAEEKARQRELLHQKEKRDKEVADSLKLAGKKSEEAVQRQLALEKKEKELAVKKQKEIIQKAVVKKPVIQPESPKPVAAKKKKEPSLSGYTPGPAFIPCDTSETGAALYTVQVGAGWMKVKYFKSITDKRICYGPDGLARFIAGTFKTKAEAEEVAAQLRSLGFSDAWVPEIDNKRCPCPVKDLLVQNKVIERNGTEE